MTSYLILLLTSMSMLTQCNAPNNTGINDVEVVASKSDKLTKKDTYPVAEYTKENNLSQWSTAVFAGGCFWCTEAAFERIDGVVDVISGYAGGKEEYPDYYGVGAGKTGHTEGIYIYYNPEIITYKTLLDVLWVAHDPTTLNRQGPDRGTQYRSAIFYQSETEKSMIDKSIADLNNSGTYSDPVVTEVSPYTEFWVAEEYHQNFYELNPNQGYVRSVSRPKVKKVLKAFPELIKKKYKS